MMLSGGRVGKLQNQRVAILTAASLSRNPRAFKEAKTVASAGYQVVVYGASFEAAQRQIDEDLARRHSFSFKCVMSSGEGGIKQQLLSFWRRVRTRAGVDLNRYLHTENSWQLGPAVVELEKQSRNAKADYYIAHLEQGSWVGAQLRRSGSRVGIDMEDWYSEDLPLEARKYRPLNLLRDLERELLTSCAHATCTSQAMSKALAAEFGCPLPTVLYNSFPWADRESMDGLSKDRRDRRLPSIHWFSQTLGHGRGLEDLFAALPFITHPAEIHLRGKPVSGFESWLARDVPEEWRGRIKVHELVSNAELLSRIGEHDIGFAGETPLIRNKDLTISNKILHYLIAGLAVVASETAGQQEVAKQAPGSVLLYPAGDAHALATRLNILLESTDVLKKAKSASLSAAKATFCWERQEKLLLETISRAFSSPIHDINDSCLRFGVGG